MNTKSVVFTIMATIQTSIVSHDDIWPDMVRQNPMGYGILYEILPSLANNHPVLHHSLVLSHNTVRTTH